MAEPPDKPFEVLSTTPQSQSAILRILDAEANRAAEGLRVVEDYVRFVLDDRHLTRRVKQLRHDLVAALQKLDPGDRLSARQSEADVGATISTPAEASRWDAACVAAASFKRLQQALRSLEEYAKLVDVQLAAAIEPLRYQAYTLERAVGITADAIERLAGARLYVLVDGRSDETAFAKLIETLVSAGVHILQLRDKNLSDAQLLKRARRLRELTRGTQSQFIMNDRPDLAVLADADGVHVGQDELSVKDARQIVGPKALVGVSTHSIEQARQAVIDGANYIGVGPTFPSSTKSFQAFTGLDLLKAVAAEIRLPAFAIGGITQDNLPQVLATGIARVAVGAATTEMADPQGAAREMLATIDAKR